MRPRVARRRPADFPPLDINRAPTESHLSGIWDRMHFASHLRQQRLGEFTTGCDLHRSDALALAQPLVLHQLVTARAVIALGGERARARAQHTAELDPVSDPVPAAPSS